jgi:hypothetical protein
MADLEVGLVRPVSAGQEEKGVDGDADQASDHGAVDSHELKIPAQLQFETM